MLWQATGWGLVHADTLAVAVAGRPPSSNICLYACMIGGQASMLPPSKAVLQYVGDARDRLARRWQAQLDGTHEHTQQEANKRHTGVLATNALGNKRLGRFFVLMHTHLIPNDNGIHG